MRNGGDEPPYDDTYIMGQVRGLLGALHDVRVRLDEIEKHNAAQCQVLDWLESNAPARNPVGG